MDRTVLVLSGQVGTGKSTLARRLISRYQGHRISTHELLSERLGDSAIEERGALQEAGERLDRRTKGTWVRDAVQRRIDALPQDALVIIDAVRIKPQLDALREAYGRQLVHLHLGAPLDVLEQRYVDRAQTTGSAGAGCVHPL